MPWHVLSDYALVSLGVSCLVVALGWWSHRGPG